MGDAIAGHILPEKFYEDTKAILSSQACSSLNYNKNKGILDALLKSQAAPSPDGESRLIANPTIEQSVVETAHDKWLALIDAQAFYMAHLIKINNFMPHLINRFGPVISYGETYEFGQENPSKGEWQENTYCNYDFQKASEAKKEPYGAVTVTASINLLEYSDLNNLADDFANLLDTGYSRLNALRQLMSDDTLNRRQENKARDSFCTRFLNGRETDVIHFQSRIEYQYFQQMDVNLGIFDTVPAVAKWLADARRKPASYEKVVKCLKEDPQRGLMLPAVMLKDRCEKTINFSVIKRQLARDFKGPIPKEGILLGHAAVKPPSGKPGLVLQP